MRNGYIVILFFLSIGFCFSQEPSYRTIGTDDGLPSRTIYDISQLKNGKIVIGHERGLSTYNGMEVVNYRNEYKTTSLSNLTIYKDQLLARNFVNELFITKNDESVERLNGLSEPGIGICSLLNYKDRLFKKTNNEIIEFNLNSNSESKKLIYSTTDNLVDFKIINDVMYILSGTQLVSLNINEPNKRKAVQLFSGVNASLMFLENQVAVFCPNSAQIVVNPFSAKQRIIHLINYDVDNKSTCIKILKDGNIYIGTFGGLYIYTPTGELLQNCYRDVQVSSIFQDIESNIWLGTLQDGIRIINNIEIQTVQLRDNEKISKLIVTDDSQLIIGTYDGKLYRFKNNEGLQLMHDFKRNNEIQSIFSDKHSTWAFCSYLVEFNQETCQVKQELTTYPTKCLAKLGDTLFCGTSKGVQLVYKDEIIQSLNRKFWIKKAVVKQNKVIFETSAGILFYEKGVLRPYKIQFKSEKLLLANATNLIESNGSIYFSLKNCVYHVDETNKVSRYKCSELIQSITKIAVAKGQVFATDGKVILELTNQKVIDKAKGIRIVEIMDIIGWQEKLIIVGKNQFQIFPIHMDKQIFPHTLNLIEISGTFIREKDLILSDYSRNNLVMRFEYLPNISSVGNGAVYYRINGVSNDWKRMEYKAGGFRIEERRLPFGKLTLEVYAVDNNDNQTETQRFSMYISPPFYFTWWFILVCIVVISVAIWRIYKHSIYLINRKNEQRMEQEQLKTKVISSELKALRSQMNPHFIFNSLSSIQSKILNDESKDAYTNLSAFSKLLRQSLKFTSQEFISLEDELDFLKNYILLEQARMDGGFESIFKIDSEIDLAEAQFPSLFSQPFVENAIRHGLAHSKGLKTLKIELKGNVHHFDFIIEDNGIGRSAANEINAVKHKSHESFATNAMEERIQMINANGNVRVLLTIEDIMKGTRVIITIQTKI